MQPTIQLDTRVFNAVFQQYAKHNRRDWAEICNDKALDVAFRALKETPKADVSGVKAVAQKDWWPKYVAKRIVSKKGVSFTRKVGGVKQKLHYQGRGYTRDEARKVSAGIIAARVRSLAFLKSGWLPAIQRLWTIVRRAKKFNRGTQGAKRYGVEKGTATVAVAGDHPVAFIVNSTIGIEKHGVGPLQRAVDASAADMRVYIGRKLEEAARRVAR